MGVPRQILLGSLRNAVDAVLASNDQRWGRQLASTLERYALELRSQFGRTRKDHGGPTSVGGGRPYIGRQADVSSAVERYPHEYATILRDLRGGVVLGDPLVYFGALFPNLTGEEIVSLLFAASVVVDRYERASGL